ncbi:hypothetical protein IU451_28895 [Nocardia cyriacigeorgica]|nr:hypothetical protein [Nocardia cyriacigeorgica]MBF6326521.1 hypothetical protein [Nocardia cyriacigeorgica]
MVTYTPEAPEVSTLDPVALCGHEECGTLFHPEIGHVTDCLWAAPLLEVA